MMRGSGTNPGWGCAGGQTVLGLVASTSTCLSWLSSCPCSGWLLPQQITTFVAVCVIGFSWVPVGLFPWEKVGLGGLSGIRPGSRRPSVSLQKD